MYTATYLGTYYSEIFAYAQPAESGQPQPGSASLDQQAPGDVRGQYGALLDSYWFKALHGLLKCEIKQIWRAGDVFRVEIVDTLADGERAALDYDDNSGGGPAPGHLPQTRLRQLTYPVSRPAQKGEFAHHRDQCGSHGRR